MTNIGALGDDIDVANRPFKVLGLASEIRNIRIDIPLHYLNLENIDISAEGLVVDHLGGPGIFIFHRYNLDAPEYLQLINQLAGLGWIIILDFDDDPRIFKRIVDNDFITFKAVHAVSVSTKPLADLIEQWNPYVQILPNVVDDSLLKIRPMEDYAGKLRIFFGAYNRTKDIEPIVDSISLLQEKFHDKIEWTVVFDKEFPKILEGYDNFKTFGLLSYRNYMHLMQQSHIALLPLSPTEFNSMKSDLKFIECCASGVIPVCSKTVYEATDPQGRVGIFPETNEGWFDAIASLVCGERASIYPRILNGYEYCSNRRLASGQAQFRKNFYAHLLRNQKFLESERRMRLEQ